jgi:alkyl hydroperoxide reductase subunit D
MNILDDVATGIMSLIGIESAMQSQVMQALVEGDARYLKDLKVSLSNAMHTEHLSRQEVLLLAIAISANNKNTTLLTGLKKLAIEEGVSKEMVAESISCASLLSANNVFYRFRHLIKKERYEQLPAKIRMNIMMKPLLGKEFFELISLAVSAVNGCELCMRSHEDSVLKLGSSEEQIWEAIRLASVYTALGKVV